MRKLIEAYINTLTVNDVKNFAEKKNINLSNDELMFVTSFIKENYNEVLDNKDTYDFSKFKNKFSEDSYNKIIALINEYKSYL